MEVIEEVFGGALHDVMWCLLQKVSYVDVMSIRFVDKKCHDLTTREELWLGMIDRDFTFLTDFERNTARICGNIGYNILRDYVFRYVFKIEKRLDIEPTSQNLESLKGLRGQFGVVSNTPVLSSLLGKMGIGMGKINEMTHDVGNFVDGDPEMKDKGLSSLVNSMAGIFKSFECNKCVNSIKIEENNTQTLIRSYRPTERQSSIYNSLIEWREESEEGKIDETLGDMILEDILDLFEKYPLQKRRMLSFLNDTMQYFVSDLQVGMKLSVCCMRNKNNQKGENATAENSYARYMAELKIREGIISRTFPDEEYSSEPLNYNSESSGDRDSVHEK